MDADSRREIGRKGGRAAHQRGTAHEWTPKEAREAGRKGGGVLLSAGDDIQASRLREAADGLDQIAATLAPVVENLRSADAHLMQRMRESIARVCESVDRIELRTR
jgi:hypothetical protein